MWAEVIFLIALGLTVFAGTLWFIWPESPRPMPPRDDTSPWGEVLQFPRGFHDSVAKDTGAQRVE